MIVSGQIARKGALNEIEKPLYCTNELEEDIEFLSKKMGLSTDEFNQIMARENKEFMDYPADYELEKRIRRIFRFFKRIKNRLVSR